MFSKVIFKQNLNKVTNNIYDSLGEMRVYVRSPFERRRCRLTNRWPNHEGDVTWKSSKPYSSVWKCCWNHHQKVSYCIKSFITGCLYIFPIERSFIYFFPIVFISIEIFNVLMHNFVTFFLLLYDKTMRY